MGQIYDPRRRCALFAAVGTSGQGYPAAGVFEEAGAAGGRAGGEVSRGGGFGEEAGGGGGRRVELTRGPSGVSGAFGEGRYGPAREIVPAFVGEVLAVCPERHKGRFPAAVDNPGSARSSSAG